MRIKEIQGLRALAVLLVIAFHGKFLSGGFIGVDIFYVISGYLITGLLLRELRETGSISLSNFYSRRIKRLLPSTFLVLVSTAVISFIVMPSSARSNLGRNIVAAALYVSNYVFAWWQNDYQNLGATPSPIIHFWSLAVEEQFYLVWPLLILLAARNARHSRVFKLLSIVTLFSLALSLFATSRFPIWSFYSLPTRAWELGIGALVVFARDLPLELRRFRWISWLGLFAIFIAAFAFNENTLFPGRAALLPILGAASLLFVVTDLPAALSWIFNLRLIQWIGDISYPLYLWHWPALVLPIYVFHAPLSIPQRLGSIAVTFVLAGLTHRFVENPLRHVHKPFSSVIRLAALGTLIVSILGVGISYSSAKDLQIKGIAGTTALKAITRLPAIYADGCQVGKSVTSSPPCVYGDIHGTKSIFLFGDSHAAQWFPTLNSIAENDGFKLVVLTKSSCPAASVQLADQGAFRNEPCQLWRENSFRRIQSEHPWAVIVSNFEHYSPPKGVTNATPWWRNGVASTMVRLNALTQHSIYIQDTPWPNRDIPSCLLQEKISACAVARPAPELWLSQILGTTSTTIDPTNWFCSKSCPAILEGIVVYRDSTHMSVDFAMHLDPLLTKELAAAGVLKG
jgi:peptidoglycan/LPS O-acetylase OafA/YrhL